MPIALKNETYEYILEAEREMENPTVFEIGTITAAEFVGLEAMSRSYTRADALDRLNAAVAIIGKDKADKMTPAKKAAAIHEIDPKCSGDDLVDWAKYRIAVLGGLQAGLRGWREFPHSDGTACPFATVLMKGQARPTYDTLASLDRDSMQEIYNEIMRVNRLAPAERVNLALVS